MLTRSAIVDDLLGRSSTIPQPKRRKRIVDKQPRRGELDGVGVERWRIPLPENVWDELRRPQRYDESSWDGKRFMSIYGVPAKVFDELVAEASQHDILRGKTHHGDGRRGPISKPVELKVAAVMETCQAGLLFKTAERLYNISEQVIESFFHRFMQIQVEFEYKKHVYPPTTREHIDSTLKTNAALGFPGAISMADGTKWQWLGCPFAEAPAHTGKEGKPSKLFMVCGDAVKMVHHVHGSHPGARNDLTAAKYDEFIQSVKNGDRYADELFELYSDHRCRQVHRGLWIITDNGFHKWRVTQFPSKISSDIWLQRWSKRLESVRKPGTECIYGILKKRFRILALPCPFRDTYKVDNCFRFLCSLHNRLQRHYGLDKLGELTSDWKAANHERDDELIAEQNAVRDGTLPHLVNDAAVGNTTEVEFQATWSSLRSALVTHFQVQWENKDIFWMKKASECRPNYRTETRVRRTGTAEEDFE